MENIKIIKRCNFRVGDVVNLGKERNERAVKLELAEWTDEEITTVEVLESESTEEVAEDKNGAPKTNKKK